ncbi:MAG: hypothetical protein K2R98_18055 [Gemmataceae bacterium]|nr:hypothetical protein [Gemmataceae bacterium]
MLDLYISEMSATNSHGGGLTLQRVLGDDLFQIKRYAHLSGFSKEYPPIAALRSRNRLFTNPFDAPAVRQIMGGALSHWLYQSGLPYVCHSWLAARGIAALVPGVRPLTALICPQARQSILATERLKRRREIRYITWIMDDHILKYDRGLWRYSDGLKEAYRSHLQDASTVFVISPALAEFYRREFGVNSTVLFGPGDISAEPRYMPPSGIGPLTIGYFGALWNWQLKGLNRIANVLRPGLDALHIYSAQASQPWVRRLALVRRPAVELKGAVAKEQVVETMRRYDAVLIPLSFDDAERNMVEFNISTKMAEYLGSGTVTLVYGPPYAAMVRFLQQHPGTACILDDDSLADWPRVAAQLKDAGYRRTMLDAANRLVEREMSTEVMRKRWRVAFDKLHSRSAQTRSSSQLDGIS